MTEILDKMNKENNKFSKYAGQYISENIMSSLIELENNYNFINIIMNLIRNLIIYLVNKQLDQVDYITLRNYLKF